MLRHVLEVLDLLDSPTVDGPRTLAMLERVLSAPGASDPSADTIRPALETTRVRGERGSTDFLSVTVPGLRGRTAGGDAPTLGSVLRLGEIGARPEVGRCVSDGDGAAAALSAATSLLRMWSRGDRLECDVIFSTQVCPAAPTLPHPPVPFMDSPGDI